MALTRRAVLAGSGALVGAGVVGGLTVGPRLVRRATRDCGELGDVAPPGDWDVRTGMLRSRSVSEPVGYAIARPPGAPGSLPVVVCLPGRGGTGNGFIIESLRFHDIASQLRSTGSIPALAIAAVDGGESYWHRRSSGEDRARMLLREFLPLLANAGLGTDGRPVALAGWSMGGYGALLAASRNPTAFRAVAVASPALWTSPGETAEGAFDSAEDYRAHDVFASAASLRLPLRVDCGTGDPFIDATRAFVARLPSPPAGELTPGCHDTGYWRRITAAQLTWLGQQLT